MTQDTNYFNVIETIFYGLLVGTAVGLVFYLFHFDPVGYTKCLITEDQWGEYLTSISYGLSSLLLIILLFKPAKRSQKIVWAMIGLVAFFIGAEEISWGQRILHWHIPLVISDVNMQNEINFHNLKDMQFLNNHELAAYIVLGWSIFSVATSLWFPTLRKKVQTLGLPLIPARIVLTFITVPYFFLVSPVIKSDEIGEIFLSIAVLIWVSDMFFRYGLIKRIRGIRAVIFNIGILLFVAVLSSGMAYRFPGDPGWRLNLTALRDYPAFGMYDQAERIYEYIYAHPEYLKPETRLNHARMLLELNKKNKAFYILTEDVNKFDTSDPPKEQLSSYLRRIGIELRLLKQFDRANAEFKQAIEIDKRQLESVSNQNAKAQILWSIAKTLKALGDTSAAIDTAQQARFKATSAQLQEELDIWIKKCN